MAEGFNSIVYVYVCGDCKGIGTVQGSRDNCFK